MPPFFLYFFVLVLFTPCEQVSKWNISDNVIPPLNSLSSTNVSFLVNHPPCSSDTIYDQSLHACVPNCFDGETYSNVTSRCENSTSSAPKAKPRLSCKNITIDSSEYSVEDENGTLFVTITNATFNQDNYTIENGSNARLCYPFTSEFMNCTRWLLHASEYELGHHGLQLWSKAHSRLYSTGEFYEHNDGKGSMVTCMRKSGSRKLNVTEYVFGVAWVISAVSMFVSFVIYWFIQKFQTSHTKVILSHMASLFIFYFILSLRAFTNTPNMLACFAFGIILHYTFLSSLFWLNVLAFDIWKRMPNVNSHQVSSVSSPHKRFFLSSLYAWGCPFVIMAIAVIVDHYVDDSTFKPGFTYACWFDTLETKAIFMYGPAAILLASNLYFFIMTVVNLRSFSKDVVMVNKKIHKQLLKIYVKLLIVMGLCWIMEVISALTARYNDLPYWYFTDVINGLQGFFFFLVYVCKRSVWKDLSTTWRKRRFCRSLHPRVYFMRASTRSSSIIPCSETQSSNCTAVSTVVITNST